MGACAKSAMDWFGSICVVTSSLGVIPACLLETCRPSCCCQLDMSQETKHDEELNGDGGV
jgi:hypothetical protein